ncbi:DNA methyltransferase [Actinomycetospora cinnamomea]|uniref:DNA methyltransferase n=1 Tax=Actinomycetospora cinnamomea TaxID=663609 RepID=UPI001A9CB7F1|nr:DNA methyltransferase [Actinomycetospora cinnamomea]
MAGDTSWRNQLYYGDNLEVLRENIASESVDLVYLDPPFNSNRSYNVLFQDKSGEESQAQIEAFDDTWVWNQDTEQLFYSLVNGGAPMAVQDALEAMHKLLGENDVLAYLVMMTARLVELHRVMKPTATLWLHCDPTASHYLKIILDATFGPRRFINEVIWQRAHTVKGNSGQGARHLGRATDTILVFGKSENYKFNQLFGEYDEDYLKRFKHVEPSTGRRYRTISMIGPGGAAKGNPSYEVMGVTRYWRYSQERMQEMIEADRVVQSKPGAVPERKFYLDEAKGSAIQSLWTDLISINPMAAERLGYPTQKPLSLLERIVEIGSDKGDIVLDPFAGCGTTVDAAQKLDRRWIGIDVTTIAIDLIDARLRHTYGETVRDSYSIHGIPRDMDGAHALFKYSPFEFERWCVMLVDGTPNEKQVGDKGIDGVIRFLIDAKGKSDRVLVSVKGGTTNPGHVRDLIGTVQSQKAAMGVFICMKKPTKAMLDAANHSGIYKHPGDGKQYPKVQIMTVEQLLNEEHPKLPVTLLPYLQAQKRSSKGVGQVMMDYSEPQGMFEIDPS